MAADSPLAHALQSVGDRWTLQIVDALMDGPKRFGELERGVEGIAPNTLSSRLQHLDRETLVVARPYQERPPRYTYELTAHGRDLASALHLLTEWGARRIGAGAATHATCGTELEPRLWCPTCGRAAEPDEPADVHLI